MRLIDADAVILSLQVLKAKNHKQWGKWENEITDAFIVGIDEFAKKEAQPQRTNGRWIDTGRALRWECSNCGRRDNHIYNYCPDCGVRMRDEDGGWN